MFNWLGSVRSIMAFLIILVFVFIAVWVVITSQFEKHAEAIFVVIMWVIREYFGKHQQQQQNGGTTGGGTK